jgi:uncharacterized repeat protein (TIGR01451 family)
MRVHRSIRSFIRWLLLVTLALLALLPSGETRSQANPNEAQVNKQFIPTIIPPGGVAKLRVFIYNPNSYPLSMTSLTDNLPAGMTVAAPPNATTTCAGGTVSAVPATTSFTLNGGTVPPKVGPINGECYFEVDITTTVQGNSINTIPANALNASGPNGAVTNSSPASATLLVESMPNATVSKAFAPTTIFVGQNSTLTITINNNSNSINMTNVSLTDVLPSGVTINGAATLSGCGSGTVTAPIGGDTITLTGATVQPTPNCVITVLVTSLTSAIYTNTIPGGSLQSRQGVTDPSDRSATLNVQNLRVQKSFTLGSVTVGGTTRLRITLSNPTGAPYTGVAFTDTLPNGGNGDLTVANPPNLTNTCGGTVSGATFGSTSFSLSGGTIPSGTPSAPGQCIIEIDVTVNVVGSRTNTIPANGVTTAQGATNINPGSATVTGTSSAPGNVGGSKTFIPAIINPGDVSQIRIRLNRSGGIANPLTGVTFVDNLPANVVIANPPNVSFSNCGGTAVMTRNDPPTYTPLSGGETAFLVRFVTIPATGNCDIFVNVTSTVPGVYTNTIPAGAITNDQGTSNTSALSGTLTVRNGLEVSKQFTPDTITAGGYSTITITLTNRNTFPLTGVNLTDPLPNTGSRQLRVRSPANASTTCVGGTLTATPGSDTVTLTGAQILAQVGSVPGTCTITFDVVPFGSGPFTSDSTTNNTIPAGNVTSNEGVNNLLPASATLNFTALTMRAVKEFDPPLVYGGADSLLTITLTNQNSIPLTQVSFTDNFPSGMIISAPVFTNTTCPGGVVSAIAGNGFFSFSGGTIPPNSSCVVQVRATITVNGNLTNVIPAGQICAKEGVCNPDPIAASLTNLPGVSISKVFVPSTIAAGGVSTLVITIRDTGGLLLTNASATDNLPAGLTVASPANASTTCASGTVTAIPSSTTISLSGATIPANGSCTFQADVTGTVAGSYLNTIPAGALNNDQGVSNAQPATATLNITPAPPSIAKTFSPTAIEAGGVSTITLTITNPNVSTALTGVAVTDNLPAGMTVAAPPNATNTCGGTFAPNAGDTSVALSGGSIAGGGSCTLTFAVTTSTVGNAVNTTGNVSSTNGGTGNTATATLTVNALQPPSIAKAFSPTTIEAGGVSTITLTITNPNVSTALTGVAVTDNLPSGMTVAAPPNATNTCGGTFAPNAGDTSVALSGGTLAANSSCTLTFAVTTSTVGSAVNTTGNVSATNGGTGNTATATLTVSTVLPPSIAKAFSPTAIASGGTTTLTLTITNPNQVTTLNDLAVTDTFPTGMTVAAPLTFTNTCGGTVQDDLGGSLDAGDSGIQLTGGTLAPNSNCTITVLVTATQSGTNTTGNVSATNGGTGNTASAPISVGSRVADLQAVKSADPTTVASGGAIRFTIVLTNNGPDAADGATFSDSVPAQVTILSATCGSATGGAVCGGNPTISGQDVAHTIPTFPSGGAVTITIDGIVTGDSDFTNTARITPPTDTVDPNQLNNESGAPVVMSSTGTAADLVVTKSVDPVTYTPGGALTYTIVVRNDGPNDVNGAIVTDIFPSALVNPQWSCVATGSATCATGLRNSNLVDTVNIAAGSSNYLTYTVTALVAASANTPINNMVYVALPSGFVDPTPDNNSAPAVSNPVNVSPTAVPTQIGSIVVVDPVIVKLVDPALALPGELVTYTLTVTNPSSAPATAVVVSDTVPAVLQIISATATQGTFTISGQVVIFNVGTVNPGQVVTLTVTARLRDDAPAPSDVTNTGELRHQTGNPRTSSAVLRVTRGRLPATGLPPAEPSRAAEALGLLIAGVLLIASGALLWLRLRRR